ncbi:hypothetical protein B8281_15895 [Cellulosimicrobium sp. TH-20]|uniref:hypothetical protein n=1 Tax=Cellulosimicrobium sp. TH-20 TaxID=1980001 RepID=UPI000A17AA70|nr:hypothetical protein [Cellulosimicrobium sp. TH-20]ARK05977.1 hypothetical protein B8281_15895 [Cellulosimicrobium sp. TH-20]
MLVVPCKLTPAEREFVESLAGEGSTVAIEVLDVVGLDLLLARHDDVRRYLERDPVLEAVAEYQVKTAVIEDVDDLTQRVRDLAARAADLDPYWAPDYRIEGRTVWISVRPKSPDAEAKRPILTHFELDEDSATDADRAAFRRSIGFGIGEPVTVPIVARKESGPDFVQIDGPGILTLEYGKTPRPEERFTVRLIAPDGSQLGTHDGVVAHAGGGPEGVTLELDFYGGLTIRFLLPHDKARPGNAELNLEVGGVMVADAADALTLRRVLCRETARVEILREGQVVSGLTLDPFNDPVDPALDALDQFANDLAFVERHAGGRRRFPARYTPFDRLVARMARLALEGQCVLVPPFISIHARIEEDLPPEGVDEVGMVLASRRPMRHQRPSFELDFGGLAYDIGPVLLYSPNVGIADSGRLLRLLDEGKIGGERVTFSPDEAEPWRLVHLPTWDDHARLVPVPWEAVGIDEHGSLDRIRAAGIAGRGVPAIETA